MSIDATASPPTSAAADDSVLFSLVDGLATITLNRPDKLNSLNAAMHARLRHLLGRVADDSAVRALLLTGNGRGFCAGQDLNERRQSPGGMAPDLGQTIETTWNPLARALRYIKVPVICGVNGVAAGAGVNLSLACDLVIAARSASFVLSFSRIGLVPDAGGTYFLPRLAGSARAMGLALLGEKLSATDAAAWGLIWRCVEDGELEEATRKVARTLAQGPTRGLMHTKEALRRSLHSSFEEQLELERQVQRQCGFSHDYKEGVTAFLERRPPNFKGS